MGMSLSEYEKQILMKAIQNIVTSIQPEADWENLYKIEFVPVTSSKSPHTYIPGRFVAKIIIKQGSKDVVYSFSHNKKEYYAFRTEN